ncbi:MAG: asparagine synthase (glutamine-hydrolyzing) [Lachnospiraceae bacterium]|jgi:asparagine synthase (glutamine-hydrolysing)|nr:asparagine synthase (glutamine-hydrolyzing) [Lachnospiraceae bacterium]
MISFGGYIDRSQSSLDNDKQENTVFCSPDNHVLMIWQGYIYNRQELKESLTGYPLTSDNDGEVIIAAYQKWGETFVRSLSGSFVIALHDKKEKRFYLFRDHMGYEPLYYQLENETLYFSSSLKLLMARPGFNLVISKEILTRYLFHHYICHPDSILEGVFKLTPGELLCFRLNQTPVMIETRKYWDIAQLYHEMQSSPVNDYQTARDELEVKLLRAVSARIKRNPSWGTFLSGGYDSSLVTAMAAAISEKPVKTFSLGFMEKEFDESRYAKMIASHLGCEHHEVYMTESDMLSLVDKIVDFYDEPFADQSQIPMMKISEITGKNVNFALSGDGGDELFCGYNMYDLVRTAQKLDMYGEVLHRFLHLPFIRRMELERRLPFRVHAITVNRNPETKTQYGGSYAEVAKNMVSDSIPSDIMYHYESRYQESNWQIRRMLLDIDTYLPADILMKVYGATRGYSLIADSPILDTAVVEYSFRIAHDFKYHKGERKRIFKDITHDYIPHELLERPKVGFAAPIDKWLRGPLRNQVIDLANKDFLRNQGVFNADYTAAMIEKYLIEGDAGPATGANYSHIVWAFLVFQKWYLKYC